MKKLLMKWFPKYFIVNNRTYMDVSKLEDAQKVFKLVHVDPGKEHMHEGLGITEERLEVLGKQVKEAINNSDNIIDTMILLSPNFKHINEFYITSILVYSNVQKMNNSGGHSLLEALLRASRNGEGPTKN